MAHEGLAAALLARQVYFLPWLLPLGRLNGREYCCKNLNGDPGAGLCVDVQSGLWSDEHSGQGGTELLSLYCAVTGSNLEAAVLELNIELHEHEGALAPKGLGGNGALLPHTPEPTSVPRVPYALKSTALSRALPDFKHTSEIWEHFGLEIAPGGRPWPNLDSAVKVIAQHPDTATALWFDEFRNRCMWGEREFDSHDASELTLMLQRRMHIAKISTACVFEAVEACAHRNARHPVREWLKSLPEWDCVHRLEQLLPVGFGSETDDYHEQVGRCFLIGMVARVMAPGCQLDTMPVFEGPQGIGKTSALRELGGQWYSSNNASMQEKDFLQGLQGYWLIEIEELESVNRSSLERTKAILSRVRDDFRWSHGRNVRTYPRQCVFAGTTNSDSWNADSSGARRFWPIRCGAIDLAWIRVHREQLFAEAYERQREGEDWHKVPCARAAEEQEARRIEDPWFDILQNSLSLATQYTIENAFHVLDIPAKDRDRRQSLRIGAILRSLGWKASAERRGQAVMKVYRKQE
jgi:hypothetical protein